MSNLCPTILLANDLGWPANLLANGLGWPANRNNLIAPRGNPADAGLTTRLDEFDTFSKA